MSYKLKQIIILILLIIFFALPFYNIFSVDFVDGHDFLLHFHMIHVLERFIRKGVILPRWLPHATYGYGTPVFTFMWAVPYYLGAFLHMTRLSYQDVFKILILFPNVLSGIGFFLWIKPKYGKFSAAVSAIVYLFAPYRFLDSFIRNALGELFFFAFLPFVFYFLDRVKSKKEIILGSLFAGLMIYSHQGLSLIIYPILIIYIAIQYINNTAKSNAKVRNQLLILTGGLLLTFFYWFPVLAYHNLLPIREGKIKSIRFPPLLSLIRSKWEGGSIFNGKRLIMSFQIGLGQLGIIFLSHLYILYYLIKKVTKKIVVPIRQLAEKNLTPPKLWRVGRSLHFGRDDNKHIFILFWLLLFWLSIFFMQPVSKWLWINIPLIINLQFPFRLLFFPMLSAAVLTGILLSQMKKPLRFLLGFLFVTTVIVTNRNHLRVLNKEIGLSYFTTYQGTYDVGGEKLPQYVNLQEIKKDFKKNGIGEEFTIISGKGKIISQDRKDYESHAEIEMEEEGKLNLRRIYFPGWQIYRNGQKTENFEKRNGIFLNLSKGKSEIKAEYKDPPLVIFSNIVSIISFIVFSILFLS